MNFFLLFTILTAVSSAIIPRAETNIFDLETMDQELIDGAVENLESLLKMTIDEVQKLSDEDFDRLLDQAFYSLETEMK